MSTLWPLMQEELRRLVAQLRELSDRLTVQHDAAAAASWQRRLQAFVGAARTLGATPLPAFIEAMSLTWSDDRPHAEQVRRAAEVLDALEALAEVDATALGEGLDRLRAVIESAPAAATAPDTRLRALFAAELEEKCGGMERLLVELEQRPERVELVAPLLRAAHSIKGAARAVRNDAAVSLAHALEDRLVRARSSPPPLDASFVDAALAAVDRLRILGRDATLTSIAASKQVEELLRADVAAPTEGVPAARPAAVGANAAEPEAADPMLRVRASHVGRLIALAGTGLVENRRLRGFAERQQALRRGMGDVARMLDDLHHELGAPSGSTGVGAQLAHVRHAVSGTRLQMNDWLEEFAAYQRESAALNERIYHHAGMTRLRPFNDVASGYPRMVRDLARELGKKARVVVAGGQLAVDRDVLERLDAPLTHLLRNAVDHGIELPAQRREAGKPDEGTIHIGVAHRAGMLALEVWDDGAGVDFVRVREKIVREGRLSPAEAAQLDEEALGDMLFGAGFSTREQVSEISGRGVGLDVVRQVLTQLDGKVRLSSAPGGGTRFSILVPISRAVTRAVVVSVAGEPHAFPLLRIERLVRCDRATVEAGATMQYVSVDGLNIGLVPLAEQLDLGTSRHPSEHVDVVVVAHEGRRVGFAVDAVLGEFDLATRPLDPRLGRVADLSALAILPDGSPVVVLDVDDLVRGAFDRERRSARMRRAGEAAGDEKRRRRVLVVDDSISVRELERQLLAARGYEVDVAVDGVEAWSKLRDWPCDLVITDVDMPRMDGIELTRSIKQDPNLRSLPVVIVSYRDRPEDRARGMEARADAYFTKSDFQEHGFLDVVHGLIGDGQADSGRGAAAPAGGGAREGRPDRAGGTGGSLTYFDGGDRR